MNYTAFFEKEIDFNDDSTRQECFRLFDKGNKQYLNETDLKKLSISLLKVTEEEFKGFPISALFTNFDCNGDNKIDEHEFKIVWNDWLRLLIKPVTALLVIDVQNDFIDGSLALKNCSAKQDGKEVVAVINKIIDKVKFDVVVYSMDCHPDDHISFFENLKNNKLSENCEQKLEDIKLFDTVTFKGPPIMKQKLWPKHCVKNSWGAELYPDLRVAVDPIYIHKGTKSNVDSYSAFWDNMRISETELYNQLKQQGVTHVFVCGLAFDYCVSFTALDALQLRYATILIKDATRGTDENNMETMLKELTTNSCVMVTSTEIENLVEGKDIKIEFAKILGKCIAQTVCSGSEACLS